MGKIVKNRYRFIYDTGDIYYEDATTKGMAIYNHCRTYAVPKEWVLKHCKIELCAPDGYNENE